MEDEYYTRLLNIVSGDDLGSESSSAVNRLDRRSQTMKSQVIKLQRIADSEMSGNASGNFIAEVAEIRKEIDTVTNIAKILRLGGACNHGADKGPKCKICCSGLGGRLIGPYVGYSDGLEMGDYYYRYLKRHKGFKHHAANAKLSSREILRHLDRISTILQNIDDIWRECQSRIKEVDKKIRAYRKKQPTLEPAVVPSIVTTNVQSDPQPSTTVSSPTNTEILNVVVKLGLIELAFVCTQRNISNDEKATVKAYCVASSAFKTIVPIHFETVDILKRFVEKQLDICTKGTIQCVSLSFNQMPVSLQDSLFELASRNSHIELEGTLQYTKNTDTADVLKAIHKTRKIWMNSGMYNKSPINQMMSSSLNSLPEHEMDMRFYSLNDSDLSELLLLRYGELPSTQELDLSYNRLQSFRALFEIASLCSELHTLKLGNQSPPHVDIKSLRDGCAKFPQLVVLDLTGISFHIDDAENVDSLMRMDTLRTLKLDKCDLQGITFCFCHKLDVLSLKYCTISSTEALMNILNVATVNLSFGSIGDQMANGINSQHFRVVHLDASWMRKGTGELCDVITKNQFTELQSLNLCKCRLDATMMERVVDQMHTRYPNLASLKINHNSANDQCLEHLATLIKKSPQLSQLSMVAMGLESDWSVLAQSLASKQTVRKSCLLLLELGHEINKFDIPVEEFVSYVGEAVFVRIWNVADTLLSSTCIMTPPPPFESTLDLVEVDDLRGYKWNLAETLCTAVELKRICCE